MILTQTLAILVSRTGTPLLIGRAGSPAGLVGTGAEVGTLAGHFWLAEILQVAT